MRKIAVFLGFSIFFLVYSACDYQIPTALEVHGNPTLTFAALKDIGEMFEDMVTISETNYDLVSCINTKIRTYIIHKEVDFTPIWNLPAGTTIAPPGGIPIGDNNVDISVDFSGVLDSFSLKPVIARVFVNGNADLVNALSVNIVVDNDTAHGSVTGVNKNRSGVFGSTYTGTSLPGSTNTNIILPLGSATLRVDFEVFIPEGTPVQSTWFNGTISTEILVWIPLEFAATSDAEIIIPEGLLFSQDQDLFGRGTKDDTNVISDYVESLELSVKLNQNPFIGKKLIIWSGEDFANRNIEISNILKGNAFSFPIDEEDMEKINMPENHPFTPNFKIIYEDGDILTIPWEFRSTEFVFKAKVKYRLEF